MKTAPVICCPSTLRAAHRLSKPALPTLTRASAAIDLWRVADRALEKKYWSYIEVIHNGKIPQNEKED